MRNLILLLLRYGGFVVFLLLEAFCMFLVVRYNRTQQEIYVNSTNILSGALYERAANIRQFWNLREKADSIANVNAQLREEIELMKRAAALKAEKDSTYILPDSSRQYRYISARIIDNATNGNNNTLTLAKGSKDGIRPRQGVIDDRGLIGIVRDVSENYATVVSLLHRQIRINAANQRNNSIGVIAWRGNDPTIVKMEDVPKHINLIQGDTIVTSGYSPNRFPSGVMIGTIDTFWLQPGSNYYDIEVKLSNDLNTARYVYVIENSLIEEQEELEKEVADE